VFNDIIQILNKSTLSATTYITRPVIIYSKTSHLHSTATSFNIKNKQQITMKHFTWDINGMWIRVYGLISLMRTCVRMFRSRSDILQTQTHTLPQQLLHIVLTDLLVWHEENPNNKTSNYTTENFTRITTTSILMVIFQANVG